VLTNVFHPTGGEVEVEGIVFSEESVAEADAVPRTKFGIVLTGKENINCPEPTSKAIITQLTSGQIRRYFI